MERVRGGRAGGADAHGRERDAGGTGVGGDGDWRSDGRDVVGGGERGRGSGVTGVADAGEATVDGRR